MAREQHGVILPVVAMVLVLVLSLAAVTLTQGTVATDTATRDVAARKALQAAEAGLDTAGFRMNALSLDLRGLLDQNSGPLASQCVAQVSGVLGIQSLGVGQWCPGTPSEPLGNGSSFSYEISPTVALNLNTGTQETGRTCSYVAQQGGLLAGVVCVLGLNGIVYYARNLDRAVERRIVSTGMAGSGCPSGPRCVKRRVTAVYRLGVSGAFPRPGTLGLISSLLNTVTNLLTRPNGDLRLTLRAYERRPGSFAECTVTPPTASNPASGC